MTTENDYVEIYKDAAGQFRWRRKAGNNEVVSADGEGYKRRMDAEESAHRNNSDIEDFRKV